MMGHLKWTFKSRKYFDHQNAKKTASFEKPLGCTRYRPVRILIMERRHILVDKLAVIAGRINERDKDLSVFFLFDFSFFQIS